MYCTTSFCAICVWDDVRRTQLGLARLDQVTRVNRAVVRAESYESSRVVRAVVGAVVRAVVRDRQRGAQRLVSTGSIRADWNRRASCPTRGSLERPMDRGPLFRQQARPVKSEKVRECAGLSCEGEGRVLSVECGRGLSRPPDSPAISRLCSVQVPTFSVRLHLPAILLIKGSVV